MNSPSVKFADRINPIVVKEIRQAVKGRFTSWTLILTLAIELIIIGFVLVFSKDIGKNFSIGQSLFVGLLMFLLFVCVFLVPVSTGTRISSEKTSSNVDLFFITTLKPVQIISGKLLTAIIVILLFFTASLPFMTLTYLLRGLDLPTIFVILVFNFLVTAGCVQFCIFQACLPGGIVSRIMRLLITLFILLVVYQIAGAASSEMLHKGIGSTITTWDFWSHALTSVSYILIGLGFLFVISVALISPTSANRVFSVRLYLLFSWLATGIISVIWFFAAQNRSFLQAWLMLMTITFAINMLASVCERQIPSQRILKDIPKKPILRLPAFFLFSGPAGGVSFSIIMLTMTFLIYSLISEIIAPPLKAFSDSNQELLLTAIGLALYACCYSLTSLNIKAAFFKKSSTYSTMTGIISFLLVGSILPVIIGFLLRQNIWEELSPLWYIGNPMVLLLEEKIWVECFTFTGIWASVAFSISLPWFFRQLKSFKPI
ncbi:MAG: hypothetical protein JW806_06460 [Sedimentisphaerales bacterium]|nr:hypothetical protein [Sedimentisphaerales bacterium]